MEAFLKNFQHLEIQLEAIKSATGIFDDSKLIGEGGFGKVYEGVLTHSKGRTMVAFKCLKSTCGQGNPEFLKEIVLLSRYTHDNLISLVGFCNQEGEKILVYEHAYYRSLDQHLCSTTLNWRQRLTICLGAAMGLCYLHDPKDTHERVIHRDIKSSNILLDENLKAKISDMGLSKIGPANQQQTFLLSDVAGTLGYVDPLYMVTGILTKESDVYSFGVVLLEVLCGKVLFEYNNGNRNGLVRTWKKSYIQKDLDKMIFEGLKQQMDPRSLETFSAIAYHCLKKSREKRPKMSHVVEELDTALRFQENFDEVILPMNYEELCKTVVPSVAYRSEEELKILLSRGIFVNGGKTWFWLNKNGEHCEMISAEECFIPITLAPLNYQFYAKAKPRFAEYINTQICFEFKIRVRAQFLSPHVTYALNLVFCLYESYHNNLQLNYILAGETKPSTLYLADNREDRWLTAELYQFTSVKSNIDLEITFESRNKLLVEGIEFQPLENVDEYQVLDDGEVDMQIRTNDNQTGIRNGEKWISFRKNGKNCCMLSARHALQKQEWNWRSLSLPESRFEEVAFDPLGSFRICYGCYRLSSGTAYAVYLVYKLQENHSGCESPLKVVTTSDISVLRKVSRHIYLQRPQTPIIRRKVYENTHNPLNRPKIRGLPQQRKDGWMEVLLHEFRIHTPNTSTYGELTFTLSDSRLLKGLIVQGIEFRPCNWI